MKRLDQYSQVFLHSPRLVAELVGHSNIKKSDLVLDIGAGTGIITAVLAGRCKQVYAIEPESSAATKLRQNTSSYSNVKVSGVDFMDYPLPPGPYKVFSNIPFHLSSPIVQRLTQAPNPPGSIYLIVQKQFANKLLANNRHFTSQLGATLAPWWVVRIRKPLRKTDFTPPPAVDTVLLEIKRRTEPLVPAKHMSQYSAFIKTSFETPGAFHKLPLVQAKISPEITPSMLTGEQWANCFSIYASDTRHNDQTR